MTTDEVPNWRPAFPFVYRFAQLPPTPSNALGNDVPASEDPLPAILNVDADGQVLSRQTRYTFVERETNDDR